MLLRETPSSWARTLTFSPASIRRKASSLNSRLNRLGSFVLTQSSPGKENCRHFPCLTLGVHSTSIVLPVGHQPGNSAACSPPNLRRRNPVSTTPGGISAVCEGAARQRGRRITQGSVGVRGRRRSSPAQAHSCTWTGLLPDPSARWRVARQRIYGDEAHPGLCVVGTQAAAFRSTLRLIATNKQRRARMYA
jgi:hypothetical protein